jgi:hypothetical protein
MPHSMKLPLNRSTLAVWVIWIATAAYSILVSIESPPPTLPDNITGIMKVLILAGPALFFSVMSLGPKQSPFYVAGLARRIDARLGAGVFASFLVRLRPLLLVAMIAAVQSAIFFWHATNDRTSLLIAGFMLSGSLGFAASHFILHVRKAVGVHPRPDHQETYGEVPRATLRESLRRYWWALSGLALFPLLMVLNGKTLRIPFDYVVPVFLAVGFLALWPVAFRRASSAFWLVAMAVWAAGAMAAMLLNSLFPETR